MNFQAQINYVILKTLQYRCPRCYSQLHVNIENYSIAPYKGLKYNSYAKYIEFKFGYFKLVEVYGPSNGEYCNQIKYIQKLNYSKNRIRGTLSKQYRRVDKKQNIVMETHCEKCGWFKEIVQKIDFEVDKTRHKTI
jgi:hypothetical protein